MALQNLIEFLSELHIPATEELPNGKWAHTQAYWAVRVNGQRGLERHLLTRAADGDPRARLQYAALKSLPMDQVDKRIQRAIGDD